MPAYSFKERFVPLIKTGDKTQTIRNKRKGQAKIGDKLYLYYGMRTKWCTKIGEAICSDLKEIVMITTGSLLNCKTEVFVAGNLLDDIELETLAKADGFPDWETMNRWWQQTHSLPFTGDVIFWEYKNFIDSNLSLLK